MRLNWRTFVEARFIYELCEYFDLNGRTLIKSSDQFVEAAHHKVKAFFEARPNYNHKEKVSVESGKATLAGIVHFN